MRFGMQVSVESTGNIDRKMTVAVPADRIEQEVEKRLKSMRGRVRIDGFRPGKVPMSVVKQRYSDSARYEAVTEIMDQTYQQAIMQEKLRVAGAPQVDMDSIEAGKDFEYTATFQVYPEFEIADVSSVEVTRPTAEINDADIDTMIETIRKQQQTWAEADRAAQDGDLVNVDFEGSLNGEAFEGGRAEDYAVELGVGRMLKDFEAALHGMKVGDENVADVTFPDDYQAENLKGQTVQFKLTMKKVQEPALPEIDDEFIKRFGVEAGDMDGFRAEVKKNMQRELDNAVKTQVKQQVMDGLAALHEVDAPDALVTDEIKHIRDEFAQNAGGVPAENLPDELFKDQATKRVQLGLIVGEVIRQQEMQRDQARVDAMLESLAASYEDPNALIEYYRNNPQAMQTIEAAVMEEMIVEWVLEKAKVTDEQREFDAVMNPSKNTAQEAA